MGRICLIEFLASITMTDDVKVCSVSPLAARPALLTMSISRQQWLGQFARTSVLLAAAVALTTLVDVQPAAATCGDYVMVGGHGNHGHTDHDSGMPGVPTCHGPNCQRQAPLPVAPTKSLVGGLPSDVACWMQIGGTVEPPQSGWIFEGRISLAKGHSLPPLRPPCL